MDNSFIKYSRALHNNPTFKNLSYQYRHVFLTILVNMAYEPMVFDDHGIIIELKPGQLLTTVRGLVKLCDEKDIDRSKIERVMIRLKNEQFTRQETRHTKTIITVIEPTVCKIMGIQNETTFEQKSRQDSRQDSGLKVEIIKKSKKKEVIFSSDSIEIGLVSFFFEELKKIKSDFKEPNVQAWAKQFDYLIRLDKKTPEEIKKLILWVTKDSFWYKNVLCPEKLRDQWDHLSIKMESKITPINEVKNKLLSINQNNAKDVINNWRSDFCELQFHTEKPNNLVFIGNGVNQLPIELNLNDPIFMEKFEKHVNHFKFKRIEKKGILNAIYSNNS